jgi:3-hydroxyacyl-[acyl-carrier-protein] dehydratase
MEILMDILKIKEILPHRYPFLLLDRVTKIDGNQAWGYKNVTANEEFFNGHFPEHPVMPGVLVVEALNQLGAVVMLNDERFKNKIAFLVGMDKIKITRQVVPGDRLDLHVELVNEKMGIGVAKVNASVDGKTCLKGEVKFAIR